MAEQYSTYMKHASAMDTEGRLWNTGAAIRALEVEGCGVMCATDILCESYQGRGTTAF